MSRGWSRAGVAQALLLIMVSVIALGKCGVQLTYLPSLLLISGCPISVFSAALVSFLR